MSQSRKSRRSELMGNHQRSWIWGRHAVVEALRSARWRPLEVLCDERLDREVSSELQQLATERQLSLQQVSADRIFELVKQQDHQGIIARLPPYPYEPEESLTQFTAGSPLLLVLDSFHDPFNFGAVLRCAEVFGVTAVIVGSREQCDVTSQVVRSSAGAVHHLPIVRCEDLTPSLQQLREQGVRLVAGSEKGTFPLPRASLLGPVALLIGNEGSGIAPERLALCAETVTIPQAGQIGSLNAAVSAGILLYEAVRQRAFPSATPSSS